MQGLQFSRQATTNQPSPSTFASSATLTTISLLRRRRRRLALPASSLPLLPTCGRRRPLRPNVELNCLSSSEYKSAATLRRRYAAETWKSAMETAILSPASAKELCDSVDAFLFDCDGVIWKGDKLIDGASQALDLLRSMGKKLIFVTNNSTKSRRKYAEKFLSLGITVSEDEIFCSSFAAAMYLKSIQFPSDKKVYVVGENGILDELELAGFVGLGGPEDGKKTAEFKASSLFEHDKSVGAVVVGLDQYINYYKLQYATLCIRENPGCLFIATNRDAVGHMTDLQEWPGAGCMVAAVCGTTQKEPIVVGKPSTFLMDFLLKKFDITTSRMCMVGDRLDTDILFGQNSGCKTLLVLSGVTTESALQDPSNEIQPDYYTQKLSDLLALLRP